MLYRTLHWYIFRELLRVFLLTASALTTLLAFGGTFKPFIRQGIEIRQLLLIMLYLMPAMLAYAIPIAALFAAVLVYWRMSTDNELTACRAGGISFIAIVIPAFFLGLVVASVDLGFVNYVVPRYLQATERAVVRDLGSLIYGQIGRQEVFRYGKLVVYADSAEPVDSTRPDTQVVKLYGMAASYLEPGKTSRIVVAKVATITITNNAGQENAELDVGLEDATAFDANSFKKIAGSINSLTADGRPYPVPSLLKSKPKFLNLRQLFELDRKPWIFPPVAEAYERIETAYQFRQIARNIGDEWQRQNKLGLPLTLQIPSTGAGAKVDLFADDLQWNPANPPERPLTFLGKPGSPVRIEQSSPSGFVTFTADQADLVLSDDLGGAGIIAAFSLKGHVQKKVRENITRTTPQPDDLPISGLILPPAIRDVPPGDPMVLIAGAGNSPSPAERKMADLVYERMRSLDQTIGSELHSRGSFSLSCLTLVLLGAALGILLRGRNPLAVFVVGFVPAVFLVLLITAGRELAEGDPKTVVAGKTLIWAGNVFLLLLVAGVYAKLLRH